MDGPGGTRAMGTRLGGVMTRRDGLTLSRVSATVTTRGSRGSTTFNDVRILS